MNTTITWGVTTNERVEEGAKTFSTREEALDWTRVDFDLSSDDVQTLDVSGQLLKPAAYDAWDWIVIR